MTRQRTQVPTANTQAQSLEVIHGAAAAHLREANEQLVLATLKATTETELAVEAAAQAALRAQLEVQRVEVQRLESLVVLAGGVAHDFNNLLTIMLGNVDMGLHSPGPHAAADKCFLAIGKAAARAADLTHQLMAYAGKGNLVMAPMDLGSVAEEITELLATSMPPQVTLRCDIPDRLPYIKGDTTQLFQIILNLVTNAAEACAPGKPAKVTVLAESEQVDPAAATAGSWVLPLLPGLYVTLAITDTGHGMTDEILKRSFEPFFSTKFVGRGLGLAAVLGILRSHGGGIWVQSQVGVGSTFKIYLPALQGARSVPSLNPQPFQAGVGSLLIADADRAVRRRARTLAEALGLTVLESRDGLEAVRLFDLHSHDMAVVLLDNLLPPLGGHEVFRRMASINQRIPVVLTSSFAEPSEGHSLVGPAGTLKKPFRAAEFQALLRNLMPGQAAVPAG